MPARRATADMPACPSRIAVLGADMSAGGRFEVQRALRVGPHTVQLVETLADEQTQAHGLIPARELGTLAISSVLLHPLPAGSGLTVTLNPAVTLHTALTYVNALLTAGVTDADVGVAAPASQRALGTTALLGLLRAASAACLPVAPVRRDLAIREVVLTGELAGTMGRQAAPSTMLALKGDAVSRRLEAPSALAALVARDVAARGLVVPPALRPALVAFLRDLVISGVYRRIAAAAPSIASPTVLQTTVRSRTPSAPMKPLPIRRASHAPSRAGVWRGAVTFAAAARFSARLRGGVRIFHPAPAMLVYRNGERGSPGALQRGDAVTVTTNAAGLATIVQAAGATPRTATATTDHTTSAPAAAIVLAVVVVLALVGLPVLVALWRRRQVELAPRAHAGTVRIYIPKRIKRAPLKRKSKR